MSNLNTPEPKEPLISAENYDIVSVNLQQLDALIDAISGEGFANFNRMNDDAKSWYLLNMSTLSYDAVKAINDKKEAQS
jgi:hypothetical protein